MTQKEAIIEALKRLGGKACLNDIYRLAYTLADFSGSKNWKATIRWYLQKETDIFRSTKRGWWELTSYQEEIAIRDRRIAELEAIVAAKDKEIVELKERPTEDNFVKRMVNATKNIFGINRKHADYVRQVLLKLGRDEEQEELLAWIERREQKTVKKVTKKIIQKISNSQVFNGSITESEFNGGGTNNEE
ncbi:MAG: hypothetical protein J6O49_15780 [Bacteroidaceae bacterium]|nr:hypothetical protein [Bacteroidaceae bacterium]